MGSLQYEALGFDLDPETIELFDSILLNILGDKELNDEFKKLKFVLKLHDKYDSRTTGPIRQIIEKLGKIEQDYNMLREEHIKTQIDMRRAVADMTEATRTIRTAAMSEDRATASGAAKKLEGMEHRLKQYSWNHNGT